MTEEQNSTATKQMRRENIIQKIFEGLVKSAHSTMLKMELQGEHLLKVVLWKDCGSDISLKPTSRLKAAGSSVG